MSKDWPVVNDGSRETRKCTSAAPSSMVPVRLMEIRLTMYWIVSGEILSRITVLITEGEIVLTGISALHATSETYARFYCVI